MADPSSFSLWTALGGAAWTTSKTVVNYGVRIVTFVVLARLLTPEDFGIVSLALALIILADFLIVEGGWSESLIRRDTATATHYDTVFWLVMGASLVIAGAVALGAHWYAARFGEPGIVPLIYALLVLYPLAAIRAVPRAVLTRAFDFRAIALSSNSGVLAGSAVAIALAAAGAGVWALVANLLIARTAMTAGLVWRAGWRPGLAVSRAGMEGLSHFVPNTILAQTARFGDFYMLRAFIGMRSGIEAVGLYTLAVDIRTFLRNLIVLPAAGVVMPSVRELREDPPRLRNALRIGLALLTAVVFPASAGFALIAGDLVPLALGAQWAEAVPMVQILALTVPAIALVRVNSAVQLAYGHAGRVSRLAIGSTGLLAVLLFAFSVTTAVGAVAMLALRAWIVLPVHLWQMKAATGFGLGAAVRAMGPNALATAVMAGAVIGVQSYGLANAGPVARVAGAIAVGLAVYAAALWAVAPRTTGELRAALTQVRNRRKRR